MADKKSARALGQDPFEDLQAAIRDELSFPKVHPEPTPAPLSPADDESGTQAEAPIQEETGAASVGDLDAPETSHLLDDWIASIDQEMSAVAPSANIAASNPRPGSNSGKGEQYVVFSLAGTDYAARISNVLQTDRPLKITPVPNVPGWVLGVVNLRGNILSMVDLRAFLGMSPNPDLQNARMLVAQSRNKEIMVGFLVDQVKGIRFVSPEQVRPAFASIDERLAPYLQGIYEHENRMVVMLDFDRMLLSAEMRQFEPN